MIELDFYVINVPLSFAQFNCAVCIFVVLDLVFVVVRIWRHGKYVRHWHSGTANGITNIDTHSLTHTHTQHIL